MNSPYPVILSLECHCCPEQQLAIVCHMETCFGDALLRPEVSSVRSDHNEGSDHGRGIRSRAVGSEHGPWDPNTAAGSEHCRRFALTTCVGILVLESS